MRPTLAAVLLLALSACGDEPAVEVLRGYSVTVPAGWTAEREGNGPSLTLVLHPPERTVVCRITVIEDGRRADDEDARAFITMGTDAWGTGVGREPARIDTSEGPLEGVVIENARIPSTFGVRALSGDPHVEIVAAPRGHALVAGVVGHFPRDARSTDLAAACREAIASMRR